MDPGIERKRKAHYPEMRERARYTKSGDVVPQGEITIMDLDDEALEVVLQDCWDQGGFYTQYPFADQMTTFEAGSRTRRRPSFCVPGIIHSAQSGFAPAPATSRPTTSITSTSSI